MSNVLNRNERSVGGDVADDGANDAGRFRTVSGKQAGDRAMRKKRNPAGRKVRAGGGEEHGASKSPARRLPATCPNSPASSIGTLSMLSRMNRQLMHQEFGHTIEGR